MFTKLPKDNSMSSEAEYQMMSLKL